MYMNKCNYCSIYFIRNVRIPTGVAVDQVLKGGWTCLMFASSSGRPQVVEYILQQGANSNMHKGELALPYFL